MLLDELFLLSEFELLEHLLYPLVLEHPVEDYSCVDCDADEKEASEPDAPVEPSVL